MRGETGELRLPGTKRVAADVIADGVLLLPVRDSIT